MEAALVILDGWGLGTQGDPDHRNAVADAETPNVDRYAARGAVGSLTASGRSVGLPDGQMGNSEVGHLNIGAGRIVYQEYTRITEAIARSGLSVYDEPAAAGDGEIPDPPFDRNPAIVEAFQRAEPDNRVHLMGLVSDGGVHSDYRHLFALIEMASNRGVDAVTHVFTDGRDTDPYAGSAYVGELLEVIEECATGDIATVSGRYFAMDRDQRWERTWLAYDAMVNRSAPHRTGSATDAIEDAYERGTSDEFIEPTVIEGQPGVEDGDVVIMFNFRADRARQLVRMLASIRPEAWRADGIDPDPPGISITTMTEYDRTFGMPVAFESMQPTDTLGEVLEAAGLTQLRIAESEKYAHVTYFLNGGRETEFEGEIRHIVPSPDVATYDEKPEMSAAAVTDTAIRVIENQDPDVMVLNYANPDMVGHTGDYAAAMTAVETVDRQLGRLVQAIQGAGGATVITADHGNADDMGSVSEPHTAHTDNDVPVIYLTATGQDSDCTIREGGILGDLAPTILEMIGVDQPPAMTGESLLDR